MKKTIVLMLVLVFALSLFIFTACDDDKESGKGSSTGVVFNESMTYEEALAAVQADSEFTGHTYYHETYDENGELSYKCIEADYANEDYNYFYCYEYYADYNMYLVELDIVDFNDLKYYYVVGYTGEEEYKFEELDCYYEVLTLEEVAEYKQKNIKYRDDAIEDFFDAIEDGKVWDSDCEESDGYYSHYSTKIEGTSLTFICDCGKCKVAYKDFNASYTLPEEYSNYKSVAKLYVDQD